MKSFLETSVNLIYAIRAIEALSRRYILKGHSMINEDIDSVSFREAVSDFVESTNRLLERSYSSELWCDADFDLEGAWLTRNNLCVGLRFDVDFTQNGMPILKVGRGDGYEAEVLFEDDGFLDFSNVFAVVSTFVEVAAEDAFQQEKYQNELQEERAREEDALRWTLAVELSEAMNQLFKDLCEGIPGTREYDRAYSLLQNYTIRVDGRATKIVFDVKHHGPSVSNLVPGYFLQEDFADVKTLCVPLDADGKVCPVMIEHAVSSYLDSL